MALLCITSLRDFHSACNSSDIFPKERSQIVRGFCKESLRLLSVAFTFAVFTKSWRKPALSKESSKLCLFSWKNSCRDPALEEATLDRGSCTAQPLVYSPSSGKTDPQKGLLLCPCPQCSLLLLSSKPLSNVKAFCIIFPYSFWMGTEQLKYTHDLPLFLHLLDSN